MKLLVEEANVFFTLMWGLQSFINQQYQILPGIKSAKEYADLPVTEKMKVRDKLWKSPNLMMLMWKKTPTVCQLRNWI